MKEAKVELDIYRVVREKEIRLTLVDFEVPAGFPSPAEDFFTGDIDLNDYLIKNPSTTFLAKVRGDSMERAKIFTGDIIVIDRDVPFISGKIAVCKLEGKYTLKKLKVEKEKKLVWLLPETENEAHQPIRVTEDQDFVIFGIVTWSLTPH